MIYLHVEPQTSPMSWEKFISTKPNYSVALDGYVSGVTTFCSDGPYANFDHHSGVDRLSTHSTCGQILLAIRQGLFNSFRLNGEAEMHIYVNDCDEDVCTSVFLLKNHFLAENSINPQINKLVNLEDLLDSTGGCYSLHKDLPVLKVMNWIFEPYRSIRENGILFKKEIQQYLDVIEDVGLRIEKFINGQAKTKPLDTRYEVIDRVGEIHFVKEIGSNARFAMFSDGIKCFVSVKDNRYVLGKISPYIQFDLDKLYEKLNLEENSEDKWGGSNLIGGSPRVNGTNISYEKIKEIVSSLN